MKKLSLRTTAPRVLSLAGVDPSDIADHLAAQVSKLVVDVDRNATEVICPAEVMGVDCE